MIAEGVGIKYNVCMGAKKPQPKTTPKVIYQLNSNLQRELFVQIYSDTTPEQLSTKTAVGRSVWSQIARKQKGLPGVKLSKREMHEKLYTLHYQHKWSYKKCRELAKQEWGWNIKSLEDVGQIIYRVAKKINPELYIDKKKKKN